MFNIREQHFLIGEFEADKNSKTRIISLSSSTIAILADAVITQLLYIKARAMFMLHRIQVFQNNGYNYL